VKEIGFEKGQRKVIIAERERRAKYFLPRGAHINVLVAIGASRRGLMDGPSNPHDILRVSVTRSFRSTWSARSRRCIGSRA
jgi:hypothetical protein